MPKTVKNDVTGKRFNSLVAIKFIPDESDFSKFLFRCDCGAEKIIMTQSVIRGLTKSCGCYQKEMMRKRETKHGHNSPNTRSKTYNSWASMMDRCEWGGNKIMYSRYGGKGLKVCHEWHNFVNFLKDMGERPVGTSIDRLDNSKGYFKENCRWATRYEQSMNTTRTVKVLVNNEVVKVKEFCEINNISVGALRSRAVRRNGDYVLALRSFGIECSYAK